MTKVKQGFDDKLAFTITPITSAVPSDAHSRPHKLAKGFIYSPASRAPLPLPCASTPFTGRCICSQPIWQAQATLLRFHGQLSLSL